MWRPPSSSRNPRPALVAKAPLWGHRELGLDTGISPCVLAVTFSSVGLSRANNYGLTHRGLAIAGLCISFGALVLVILAIASCVTVVSGA